LAADQEEVSKILSVLSHRIRREILLILHQKGETSFTELMKELKIDTGKLSFHIRNLSMFMEQTESGKYRLNRTGEDAVRVVMDVESWAQLAGLDKKTSQLPLATLRRRAVAFLVDFGIMLALAIATLLPTVASVVRNPFVVIFNMLATTLAILWIYCTILEGFRGQTVGKRALGMTAIRVDGKKVDYEHAAVRNFGKVLLPFDLAFGYRLKDPKYIRYFDKFAGTTVIELRKRTQPDATEELEDLEASEKTLEPAS